MNYNGVVVDHVLDRVGESLRKANPGLSLNNVFKAPAIEKLYFFGAGLCAVVLWVDYILCESDFCGTPRNGLVEGVFLCLVLVFSCIFSSGCRNQLGTERADRVEWLLSHLKTTPNPSKSSWDELRVYDSQVASLVYAYRGGEWIPVPGNFLIKGDRIVLQPGDLAPARLRIEPDEGAQTREDNTIILERGDSIGEHLFPPRTPRPASGQKKYRAKLCTVLETPLVDDIERFLASGQAQVATGKTMLRKHRKIAKFYIQRVVAALLALSIVANCTRYAVRSDGMTWFHLIFARQVYLILCIVAAPLVFWEYLMELWATAKLLSFQDQVRQVSRTRKRFAMSMDDETRNEMKFEIDTIARKRASFYQVVKLFVSLCWCWRPRLWRSGYEHGNLQRRNIGDAYTLPSLLALPMRSFRLVQMLGSMTVLCCVDEKVVLAPLPSVEELYLLKGEKPAAVLDMCTDKSSTYGVRFENPHWIDHMSSLKPVALACMLGTCLHEPIVYESPKHDDHSSESDHDRMLLALSKVLARKVVPDHLRQFAQVTGFRHGDISHFCSCLEVRISDPIIRAMPTPRTVLSWSYHRGEAHVFCQIVEDLSARPSHRKRRRRKPRPLAAGLSASTTAKSTEEDRDNLFSPDRHSQHLGPGEKESGRRALHLLSWGHPHILLRFCSEYWDGDSIWPLRENDKESIMDIHKKWYREDFDAVAFAYAPIPPGYAHYFPRPPGVPAPVHVVHVKKAHVKSKSRERLSSNLIATHRTNDEFGEPENRKGNESTTKDKVIKNGSQAAQTNVLSRSRDQILREIITSSQIFTGMIGSQEQVHESFVDMIEDLDSAGVRFVHFSPRDPRRARVLADKMGLETDWNTAISLKELDTSAGNEKSVAQQTPRQRQVSIRSNSDSDLSDEALSSKTENRDTLKYPTVDSYVIGQQELPLERSEWDVKAKLPHGIKEIRKHLEQVDDVPLRVATFTDSTPKTSREMMQIMQENGEIVAAVGSSLFSANSRTFLHADAAISIQHRVLPQCCTTPFPRANRTDVVEGHKDMGPSVMSSRLCRGPLYHPIRKKPGTENHAIRQLEISAAINSLACCLVISNKSNLSVLVDVLAESRRLVMNYKQAMLFIAVSQLLLLLVLVASFVLTLPDVLHSGHLLWLIWVVMPTLSLPMISNPATKDVMDLMPSKNDEEDLNATKATGRRLFEYVLLRTIPTAIVINIVFLWTVANLSRLPWSSFVWSDINLRTNLTKDQLIASQAFVLFVIVWFQVWMGLSFLYRTQSLLVPRSNTFWWIAAFVTLGAQLCYGEAFVAINQNHDQYSALNWLSSPGYEVWILVLCWPVVITLISEITKKYDNKHHQRSMRRLRIIFETRLDSLLTQSK